MAEKQVAWIDAERCTGCGACIDACPVGAITLTHDTASVDEEKCTGCGACLDVCPHQAIQPVLEGELVPVEERPKPAIQRESPLIRTAAPALTVVGAGLMAKAAGALARTLGNWLTQSSTGTEAISTRSPIQRSTGRANGRGRQMRRRRRGR